MRTTQVWRCRQLQAGFGLSRSTIYDRIKAGLLPKPIALGPRAVGWPAQEVQAVFDARVRGCTDDQVRALVRELMEARGR